MMDWYFGNYWYFSLLLLLPLLGRIMYVHLKWRNKKRNLFAEHRFQEQLFEKPSSFLKILPTIYLLAFSFLVLSIVDVLKGSEEIKTNQKMNNVIFLLDVSNSMNTEDIQPNRLEEAKNIIINTLPKMKNDRVGLVVFAGEAQSIMPLTTDLNAANTYIDGIETNIIKVQGTDFLKGIETTAEKFKTISKSARKVVLISDGEDNEGNDDAAIREAEKQGITVVSVGVGTEEGAPVPEYMLGQLMGYKNDINGETVISKRQTQALKKIADKTGGTYIDGNNLEEASAQIIAALKKNNSSGTVLVKSQNALHYYQYFLAIALFLFFLIYLFNPKYDFNI